MYESNMELLGLCYDSIEQIRDGYYLASLNGESKIIDAGNNTVIDNVCNKVVYTGKKLYIKAANAFYDDTYIEYDLNTFNKIGRTDYTDFERLAPNAWKVMSYKLAYQAIGVINSDGEEVLPCIYRYVYIYSSRSNYDYLKVALHTYFEDAIYTTRPESDKTSYIIVDKAYTKADCLFAEETGIEGLQIVTTQFKAVQLRCRTRYSIRYNGKILGKSYTGIMVRKGLDRLGIVQTYNKQGNKVTTGYLRIDGTELVPTGKYKFVSYIGNNICIVENDAGFGTYVNNQEVVKTGTISNYYINNKLPITMGVVNGQHKFIGNDGNLYDKITDAFPVYQSKINQTFYLMCLYGTWLYVDSGLDRVDNRVTNDMRSKEQWIKV